MHFELNEEQQQIKQSVREFAEAEIAPHVMEWDEAQHFPIELQPKLAELGLTGVLFPEEYGGAGMGYIEYATIIEELSRVDGSVGISVAAHNSLCSNHIYQFGTEAQKQKFLVPLASGKHLGAWGLTEPSAGSDASGTRSTAVRKDNGWIVNGSKNFITHAIHADTCVAMAVTDRAKRAKAFRHSSLKRAWRALRRQKKRTSSACARRKRPALSLKIVMCLTKIVSATRAKALLMRWKCSMAVASRLRRWRLA